MKVLKFGGTSLGSAACLEQVRDIILNINDSKIVVCSAMAGVTNMLVKLVEAIKDNQKDSCKEIVLQLQEHHENTVDILRIDAKASKVLKESISTIVKELSSFIDKTFSIELQNQIITFGEVLSTRIFSGYLTSTGVNNTLLMAQNFMYTDVSGSPDINAIRKCLNDILQTHKEEKLFITQGFICKDAQGRVSNLGRGGSDYSGTIIGAALQVEEVQIWSDIDGVHNNDPRYVDNTSSIPFLSYQEASILASFGAKVLHPKSVKPLVDLKIPLYLKNTFAPFAIGTKIGDNISPPGIKSVAVKDNMVWVKIRGISKNQNYSLYDNVFTLCNAYQFPVVMMDNVENGLSLVIEKTDKTSEFLYQLKQDFDIDFDLPYSVICIGGNSIMKDSNRVRVFEALGTIPIRMISFESAGNYVLLLVKTEEKVDVMKQLHQKLFQKHVELDMV
ncbi:aspartate kinase [Aquimarina sp. EL_43]|uniref:aspartate kinase n=1 Tax=unclassified Aquimarina TaxID=2627091 RepID=UPI0018CA6E86|nr:MULTISPECIES: aspartate kinase [unclassified Aquimarina]MBG6131459.1 aspartate kinase [Aquimarina sp. EL_35]MBG6151658.1 aspartate kinase [Aquimarina sp. EL_32]MBG6169588.1 aspartate kinase [Aquimarina sp. EL_43]